jgi:hypothetical protein
MCGTAVLGNNASNWGGGGGGCLGFFVLLYFLAKSLTTWWGYICTYTDPSEYSTEAYKVYTHAVCSLMIWKSTLFSFQLLSRPAARSSV